MRIIIEVDENGTSKVNVEPPSATLQQPQQSTHQEQAPIDAGAATYHQQDKGDNNPAATTSTGPQSNEPVISNHGLSGGAAPAM